MLRIEMSEYGPPSVLLPVERPAGPLADDEAEVRVALVGVNRADLFIRSGQWPQAGGFPYVPGLETCGVVERVGASVAEFSTGDRVITMMQRLGGIHGERAGGYQERVIAPVRTLARVPDSVDLELIATLGLPAVTAFLALEVLEVSPGQRVLVQGAASAVGLMAVQMIAAQGATALGTGLRENKLGAVLAAGAEQAVSTRDPEWPRRLGAVHRVFDLVGAATFAQSVDLLSPGGRLVFVGGTSGGELAFSGWALMRPVTLTGYSSETLDARELERAIVGVARLVERAGLRVPEVTRYPLREAARAHADMEAGRITGRVVLDPRQ